MNAVKVLFHYAVSVSRAQLFKTNDVGRFRTVKTLLINYGIYQAFALIFLPKKNVNLVIISKNTC